MPQLVLLVLWIVAITSFTFFGAFYARRYAKADALIALYVVFIAMSQIMAAKIAEYDLGFITVTAPAAVLIYSVTYLFTDIVNERFGRKEVHRMILMAFVTQLAMVFFIWLGTQLEPAVFWQGQEAWDSLLGLVPRITLASWIAFLISANLDAWVFDLFKKITGGKHLWMRNAFSSIPALALDTVLFVSIAFAGLLPLGSLMVGQLFTKWLVGIINIPFMYFNRWVIYSGKPPGIESPAAATERTDQLG